MIHDHYLRAYHDCTMKNNNQGPVPTTVLQLKTNTGLVQSFTVVGSKVKGPVHIVRTATTMFKLLYKNKSI